MLELKDATMRIDGRELFKELSLMAMDGQMTCVTGRAGAGKTALLQVMLGFLMLDEGLVSIDGELLSPQSASAFRRLMAYVPQRRQVSLDQKEVDTSGLEAVWAPHNSRRYRLTPVDEHLDVTPMASKPIIIVDDPKPSLLGELKSLAATGHTVVVATQDEAFLSQADKIVTLGNDDNFVS